MQKPYFNGKRPHRSDLLLHEWNTTPGYIEVNNANEVIKAFITASLGQKQHSSCFLKTPLLE